MDADVPTRHPRGRRARRRSTCSRKTDLGAIPVVDAERKVVGIVSESDLILSEEEADLHLPHYLNIMGGIVFVGSMKGFEERLNKAFATKVSRADDRRPDRRPRRRRRRDGRRRRSPRSTTTTCPWSTATGRLAGHGHPGRRARRARRRRVADGAGGRPDRLRRRRAQLRPAEGASSARASSSARWSRPTATATAPTAAPTPPSPAARPGWRSRPRARPSRSAAASRTCRC